MEALLLCVCTPFVLASNEGMNPMTAPDKRHEVAAQMERVLRDNLLASWYPRCVDREYGGYLSTFDADWQPAEDQNKMIVTQSRHVWTAARASAFFGGDEALLGVAEHGFRFLRDQMWDSTHGGFYWLVDQQGEPKLHGSGRELKLAYGVAFGIYGLAAYADVSGNAEALELAKKAFRWLDDHAHDAEHGGYYQFLQPDGTPVREWVGGEPPKDQNSSIHILEAFYELYRVWPDPLLRERLREMLLLIRDRLTADAGYLMLYFEPDWTHVSFRNASPEEREANRLIDHISFGHDVETAYLMLEAAEALGMDPGETLAKGKRMVDHALKFGYDHGIGGFYDEGYYFAGEDVPRIIADTKNWWAQAEGFNTLLLMADHYPEDPAEYGKRFLQLWTYTQRYLIDQERGGWYLGGLDKEPEYREGLKGHIWKAAYHDSRSLMNAIRRLRKGVGTD